MSFPPPPWIATDEAGKGDYFGPLVVAGVYADEEASLLLKKAGIAESKVISDKKAMTFAQTIEQICPLHNVLELTPKTYNNLYARFQSQKRNLNHLLAWAHARVIENILSQKMCPTILVDQFAAPQNLESKLMARARQKHVQIIQQPHAEANIAVAAASVLARARFLAWLDSASRQWSLRLPKGATHVKEALNVFVQRYGKENLHQVAKVHFKTTNLITSVAFFAFVASIAYIYGT